MGAPAGVPSELAPGDFAPAQEESLRPGKTEVALLSLVPRRRGSLLAELSLTLEQTGPCGQG